MASFWDKYKSSILGAAAGGASSQFASTRPFQAAISTGVGAVANKKNPLQGAAQGALGGAVGSSLATGVSNMFTGGSASPLSAFGSGAMQGAKGYVGSMPGFGGIGTSNPPGAMAKFLTPQKSAGALTASPGMKAAGTGAFPAAPMASTPPKFSSIAGSVTPASTIAPAGIQKKSMFNQMFDGGGNAGTFAGGAGVALAGGMFAPKVAASDFSPVVDPLRERINNPSEAGSAAMQTYMDTVKAPTGASAEPALANMKLIYDRQRAANLKAIDQQFRAAMPGANVTNNSAYQDAVTKMNAEMDQQYAAQAAQTQFEYDTQQQSQKQAAASALAQLDQAQIQSLANLAQYDIYSIAEQTGYDLAKSQAIKDLATTAGTFLMAKGAGAYA